MLQLKKYTIAALVLFCSGLIGCDKWDEHNELKNQALGKSVMDEISARADLSKLKEYLVKTGLDKELSSSKTYTVWAPANGMLETLEPAIVSDTAKLKAVLLNHIAKLNHYTGTGTQRIQLLNGKWVDLTANKFDEATITTPNFTTANGVLHVIDKVVKPLPSLWQFINSTTATFKQNAYIVATNFKVRDFANAVIDSIGQLTGMPVYKPGTDSAIRNRYLTTIYDAADESKMFTYFVVRDDNFQKEADLQKPFFKTSRADSTDTLSRYQVIRDLTFEGLYTREQLPSVLTSKFGVSVPINKNDIVETIRLSNGVAYVMSKLEVPAINRLTPFIVQGEDPWGFQTDKRGNINYRKQVNPTTSEFFNDMQISGHNVANYWVWYRIPNVPSAKYKVYWVAVNNGTAAFQQRLAMGTVTAPLTALPYVNVPVNNYNEVLLGEYTVPAYGTLNVYFTASGTANMALDYFKLVPTN
ncbi:MAG TPA: fasciclin domain-containing protein [Chitinophagaceae bacterium]|jgi:cytochrome c556|nr:fasciclin domain-containing protein [Chitinophagaceae bacterium]